MPIFGVASYSLVALAYAAIAVVLLLSRGVRATWLTVAAAISALWGAGLAVASASGPPALAGIVGADILHALAWIVCIVSRPSTPAVPARSHIGRRLFAASAAGSTVLVVAVTGATGALAESALYAGPLIIALMGLLAVEGVYAIARQDRPAPLRLLCLAIGGFFAVDVAAYGYALLFDGFAPGLWESRGVANALLAPAILIAIKRQPKWTEEIFVSRQVAFYAVSLLGAAIYLLAMGLVANFLRTVGGEGALVGTLLFVCAAFGGLVLVVLSLRVRSRAKVFLVKHFYRNKYDYRHEWLRLTEILGRSKEANALAASAVEGIARIIGSPKCELWLARNGGGYHWIMSSHPEAPPGIYYAPEHPLVGFLEDKGWVIDSREYRRHPERYGGVFGSPDGALLPPDVLVVPLDCRGDLLGFMMLTRPSGLEALNFEDHDILKTAGRQVAVFLAQAWAQERLAETRQFEAMNKLSTFVMHDLKNLIAQQELVVTNAQRFGHVPEFFDDAIATVRSGVERMRKVLDQLKGVEKAQIPGRVDLSKVLMEARSRCSDREPVPRIEHPGAAVWINIERERLVTILTHLIRNAQDATPPGGSISVEATGEEGGLVVEVRDSGCGMEQSFVRDRLFRPFDSTKGMDGMGIGAYQVRDTVRSVGGEVEVESEPDAGTLFRLRIPYSRTGPDDDGLGVRGEESAA